MAISNNFDKSRREIKSRLAENLLKAGKYVKDKSEENTPEHTGELVRNYKIVPVTRVGNKLVLKIYNDTAHAFFIEFGTMSAVNYNKPKGSVFFQSGDHKSLPGARMMTRAIDENLSTIKNIVKGTI